MLRIQLTIKWLKTFSNGFCLWSSRIRSQIAVLVEGKRSRNACNGGKFYLVPDLHGVKVLSWHLSWIFPKLRDCDQQIKQWFATGNWLFLLRKGHSSTSLSVTTNINPAEIRFDGVCLASLGPNIPKCCDVPISVSPGQPPHAWWWMSLSYPRISIFTF